MSVIQVNNLSKRYRIGLKESRKDTFVGQMGAILRAPIDNYKKLRSLGKFKEDDESVFWALRDINFEVQQGEVLGIIGHNGAGKSTLLKILSRITEPTSGEVRIKGRVAALLEVGTGFHPELTGRENIYMNGTILGMTRREIDKKLDEIVDFSGVEKYLDTPVKFYSSGMKVRLGFAVAAHLEPEILIIDEVLAVGDAAFQKRCMGKMDTVAKTGRTVLLVSHNLAHINNLCKEAIVLEKGAISFRGNAGDAIRHYLSRNQVDQLTSRFNKKAEDDSAFSLEEAFLHAGDEVEKDLFNADETIFIHLKIKLMENIPKIQGYITIKDFSGELIVESDSNDIPMLAFDNLEKGYNYLKLTIPKRVLPVGKFMVYLNFTSNYSKENFNIDSPGDILKFEVTDHSTNRGMNRRAATSAIVSWEKIDIWTSRVNQS